MPFSTFVVAHSFDYLDAEFDEPDVAADEALCRAIVAGRWGLHPDAWGSYETMRIRGDRLVPAPPVYEVLEVDPAWEAKHRQRPLEPIRSRPYKPKPKRPPKPRPPPWTPPPVYVGELRLTCDECGRAAFSQTLKYAAGQRAVMVAGLRLLGRQEGWTCIEGRDRCPRCSQIAPPQAVGNGAGEGERHEQHTDGG